MKTFFSVMSHNFVELSTEAGIPVDNFLNCCRSITPVFDVLGRTVFAPIKNDIQGNINKLQKTSECDEFASEFLLDMIQRERDAGKGLATDALLWLKRALEFVCEFLKEIHSGNEALVSCAEIAYARTIKKYHNWMARGLFALAVKAMPGFPEFLQDLAPSAEDWQHPDYRQQLFADCGEYIVALSGVLCIINEFYRRHNLDVQ